MIIGIDLGTTFSAAAYVDANGVAKIIENRDGERTTPSVVMFEGDGVCVGEQAKINSIVDPYNVCQFVKRQMGNTSYKFETDNGEQYTAEDISAIILRRIKEDCEEALGQRIDQAVITVPAYFNDAQRKATQDAGKIAGLEVKAVINEPTAAAIAFCHQEMNSKQKVMVFDLGGGTFDVTVMEFKDNKNIDIVATCGHKNLGGFDFDNAIINYVTDYFEEETGIDLYDDDVAMQDLREKAEVLKKALSRREKAQLSIASAGKVLKIEITKAEFERMIEKNLKDAQTIMEIAMDDANLQWKDLDKILLVGGSTRVPAVQNMIESVTGIKPSHEINPDEAVALGAAYFASTIGGDEINEVCDSYHISDVNSHSLGILAFDENHDGQYVNNIIIDRNSKLPVENYQEFCTMNDNQTEIILKVVEGEDLEPEYCTIVGETILKMKPHPAGAPIRIVMQYDTDGVIHVRVIDLVDNEDLGEMEIKREANLTEESIRSKESRMLKLNIN